VNIQESERGWTALHLAVASGRKEMVKLLLARHADVNIKAEKGWAPLHIAISWGDEEIVEMLLDNNADVNLKDEKGRTLLWYAGDDEIIRLLRAHGAKDP